MAEESEVKTGAEYKVIAVLVKPDDINIVGGRVVEYPAVDKVLAKYAQKGWRPIAMNMDADGYAFTLVRDAK